MLSAEICARLNEDAELPFAGFRNDKGIDARGLASILRPYGIRPKNVRTAGTGQGKGYERTQFEEPWARYTRSEEPADDPSQPSHRPTEAANPVAEPDPAGTDLGPMRSGHPSQHGAGTDQFEHPSRHPSQENGSTRPDPALWDGGTDRTDEVRGAEMQHVRDAGQRRPTVQHATNPASASRPTQELPAPPGSPMCGQPGHVTLWRARDGRWRCRTCEPARFAGEIVATTETQARTNPDNVVDLAAGRSNR